MASLKETNQELSTLESKLKAVELAFKNIESTARESAISQGNIQGAANIAAVFKNTYDNIKNINNSIKDFKTELNGIGASGVGIDLISKKIKNAKDEIDGLISDANALKENLGDTDIIIPTTFKFENDFEQQKQNAEDMIRYLQELEDEFNREFNQSEQTTVDKSKEIWDEYRQNLQESFRQINLNEDLSTETQNVISKGSKNSIEIVKDTVGKINNIIKSITRVVQTVVDTIVKSIRTAGNIIKGLIRGVSGIFNSIKTGVSAIIKLFGNLGNRIRKEDKSINKINKSFTELRSALLLFKGALETIFNKDLINRGQQIVATLYSMQVILGKDQADSVVKWAQSMEYAFGLSASQLISQLNELNGVLYGLGVNSKDVGVASENILIIGQHLASLGLAGGDADVAISKIVSGMKGMTQSIDDLGLSVRDAQMDAFLKKLKAQGGKFKDISTDFSSLNEEARIYIRYAALIDQYTSKYDVTQFVDSLKNEANALNLVNQSFQSMLNTIGIGLNRLFAKFATYILPIINWLNELATALFRLIGIDVTINTKDIGDAASNVEDLNSGLEETADNLDNISKAAKKAGSNLQSFDKISNITESSSSGDNNSISSVFDYSSLMTSMLEPLNKLAEEAAKSFAEELEDQLKQKLNSIWNRIKKFVKELTGRFNFDLGFDFDKIKENLNKIKNYVVRTIKSWGLFTIGISLIILDDLNIGTIITSLTDLLTAVTRLASSMTDSLIPAFSEFYAIALKPIVEYMGTTVNDAIQTLTSELDKWADWFDENKETILVFFQDLGEVVNALWLVLQPFIQDFTDFLYKKFTDAGESARDGLEDGMSKFHENKIGIIEYIQTLPEKIDDIVNKISQAFRALTGEITLDELVETSGTGWGTFLTILNEFGGVMRAIGDILAALAPDFTEFLKNEALPWFVEKLGELSAWLTTHKDDIVETLENLGSFAWEGFKLFVDAIGKLVDIIVDSKGEVVITFFKTIIGLKIASVFGGIASAIGGVVLSIVAFKNLAGFSSQLSGIMSALGTSAAATESAAAGAGAAAGVAIGPIIAIVAAIVALVSIIGTLWDTSEDFRNSIAEVGNQIAEAWDRVVGKFTKVNEKTGETESVFGRLKDAWIAFSKALEPIITILGQVLGPILGMLIEMLGTLFAWVVNIASDALAVVQGAIDVITGILEGLIGIFVAIITGDSKMLEDAWDKIWSGLKEIVGGFITAILDTLGGLGQEIIDIINGVINIAINLGGDIIDGFGKGISDAFNGFIKFVTGLWDDFIKSVKDFFGIHSPSTVFADLGDFLIQGFFNGISEAWNLLSGGAIKLFENILQGIKNVFGGIKDWFGNKFTEAKNAAVGAWDGIKSTFSNIAEKAAEGLSGIKDKAKDIFNSVKNSAGDILGGIGKAVSNGWENLKSGASNLWDGLTGKKYADGGIVTSPTYGLVGEAGPEAIIPLSSSKRAEAIALWQETGVALGQSIAAMNYAISPNTASSIMGNYSGKGFGDSIDLSFDTEEFANKVYEAVFNALVDFYNEANANRGNQNRSADIHIDGFGIINDSTLRELASMLAPYLISNGINIGDTSFSI